MKRIIRYLSFCFAMLVVMFVVMRPTRTVAATTYYNLWVNGEQFASNHMTIQCGKGTAKLEVVGDTYNLTLENAEITEMHKGGFDAGISFSDPKADLRIIVIGDNSINLTNIRGYERYICGVSCKGASSVLISSNGENAGSLKMQLGDGEGWEVAISIGGKITVKDIDLVVNFKDYYHGIIFSGESVTIQNAKITANFAEFVRDYAYNRIATFIPGVDSYDIQVSKKDDGSNLENIADISPLLQKDTGGYHYVKIVPKPKKVITHLGFTLDIPNDGEEYPNGAKDIGRVTKCPEGVKVVDVETVMYKKRYSGTAAVNDAVSFEISYEVLDGYELAPSCTVSINGERALKIGTSDSGGKVGLENGAKITYNPDITIQNNLPETITFKEGGSLEATISAKGSNLKYQWQIAADSGKKIATYKDIAGATSATLSIKNVDDSYDGKFLRCCVSNSNGNTYSKAAKLEGKKFITHLGFTLDIPNDGEEYPNGAKDIGRVTECPEGVKVVDVETVMYKKRYSGTATVNDPVSFEISYEVLDGYELAPSCTASINGERALKIGTSDNGGKVGLENGAKITYNPDITIQNNLPETITFKEGGSLEATISAKGSNLKYQWQIAADSGKKIATYKDISGATSATLKLTDLDKSYDGKLLRCCVSNGNGNTYTRVATLEEVIEQYLIRVQVYDSDGKTSTGGEVFLKTQNPLSGYWVNGGYGFSAEKGSTVEINAKAADGYNFVEWRKDGVNGAVLTRNAEYSFLATEKMELYAVFKKKDVVISDTCTVTFNMGGHGTAPAKQTVNKGSKATKPATNPSAEGWTFDGWYADTALATVFDFTAAITSDTTVYAKWTEVKKAEPTAVPTEAAEPTAVPTKAAEPTAVPTEATEPTAVPTEAAEPTAVPTEAAEPTAVPTKAAEPTAVPTNPAEPAADAENGNKNHVFLWVGLLVIGGGAIAGTTGYVKKRKKK